MRRNPLANPGQIRRITADLLQRRGLYVRSRLAARKQILRWPLLLPVRPQYFEQALAEYAVAVFGSLALFDADHHAAGVDVAYLQLDGFRDPQAPAIADHQSGAVLEDPDRGKEALDFLLAEHHRQALTSALPSKVRVAPRQIQRCPIQNLCCCGKTVHALR